MAAPSPSRWPLIGRFQHLEELDCALAGPEIDGVLLIGPAGVGKTRLADEYRQRAERDGHPTSRVIASRSAATTPLGALAHLMPTMRPRPTDPIEVFGHVAAALGSDGARRVLVIDDAHLLDETSLVVILQLLTAGGVFLIATIRSGEPIPDGLATLQRTDRCQIMAVEPLIRSDVETLLHLALGGPVDALLRSTLWELSSGVPLVLTEVVRQARASSAIVELDGVWIQQAPLAMTTRIVDLFAASIASAGDRGRRVLELLAVADSLGLDDLEPVAGLEVLDQLERSDLIVVEASERRRPVRLTHPVVGEVVRAGLSVSGHRAVLLELIDLIEGHDPIGGHGARRQDDALRVVGWRLAAGIEADVGLVLTAATLARQAHDFAAVIGLTQAISRGGASDPDQRLHTAVLLGEALSESGSFEAAEEIFAAGEALVLDRERSTTGASRRAVDLAIVRSNNLFHGLLRPADAIAVRRAAAASSATNASTEDRVLLHLGEAWITMVNGDPAAALDMIGPTGEGLSARNRVARSLSEATALLFGGQTELAFTRAGEAYFEHVALIDIATLSHPGVHILNQALALAESGRLTEAEALATSIHQLVVGDKVAVSRVWAASTLGRIALHQGRPTTARRWFQEAVAVAGAAHCEGPRKTALAGVAISSGLLGDHRRAVAACRQLAVSPGEFGFLAPEHRLATAWAAVADGHPESARELLLLGADEAARTGYATSEAWLLHDAARLGAARDVAERLVALADRCDGALVAARAAHATALAQRDGAALSKVGDTFELLGARLCAAEAAFAAADAYRTAGESRAAAAAREIGHRRAASCEGATTPALMSVDLVVPLTTREREIALLARDGLSSKEIALRLYLSPRTIDNHLQRIYTKLGITSRWEMSRALDSGAERP